MKGVEGSYLNSALNSVEKSENQVEKPEYFEVISQNIIDRCLDKAKKKVILPKIDNIKSSPGDIIFDKHEIQWKFDTGKVSNLEDFGGVDFIGFCELIGLSKVDREALEIIMEELKIELNGKLPSFTQALPDENGVVLFSVKNDNVLEMAKEYAEKEGDDINFNFPEDAKEYLRSLAPKAYFHELGHIVYDKIKSPIWSEFIEKKPDIMQKVIEIQRDKHGSFTEGDKEMIKDEAFADFMVEFLSDGEVISRLGENKEAMEILEKVMFDSGMIVQK